MQFSSLIGHTQELLEIVIKSNRPADSIIDTFFRSHKYLGSHDRKFIAETTYGTLRHLRKYEYSLKSILSSEFDIPEKEKILLLITTYLYFQNKLNNVAMEAVSSRIKSTFLKSKSPHIFNHLKNQPAVKSDSIIERMGIEYSFPDWMIKRFIEEYGEEITEKICNSLNEQAPLTIRVNTLKTSVEECEAELFKEGIETKRTELSPIGLNIAKRINVFSLQTFRNGWFEVQDEGSQLLPLLVDPKPKSKLLDLCAGAGGKTLEFSALMNNRGEIYAADINHYRLDELRKRMKRAGSQNIRIIKIDSTGDIAEKYSDFFDVVFIDAPCSGLGTIRRNPGMKWMVTERTVSEVSEKQKAILESSLPLVKEGGRIVYATCTLLRQENEEVVESFLRNHPEFRVVSRDEIISRMKIKLYSEKRYIKLLPHVHGTDGFFCAVLEKQTIR